MEKKKSPFWKDKWFWIYFFCGLLFVFFFPLLNKEFWKLCDYIYEKYFKDSSGPYY